MLLALFAGCDPGLHTYPSDSGAPDESVAFSLVSLVPDHGPVDGGTTLSVRGTALTTDTTATVGGDPCASLTWLSAQELACVTPPGTAGEVSFVVTEAGETQSLPFTYASGEDTGDTGEDTGDTAQETGETGETGDTGGDTAAETGGDSGGDTSTPGEAVDYCHLQWPCEMTGTPSATSEVVYGWIYEAGVTVGAGEGAGVSVEVGVGPDGSDPDGHVEWAWAAMTWNVDTDGLSSGDLANDEYMGTFTVPAAGAWDYAVRASADGGASWIYCDGGGDTCSGAGTDDGYDPADAGQLTVD